MDIIFVCANLFFGSGGMINLSGIISIFPPSCTLHLTAAHSCGPPLYSLSRFSSFLLAGGFLSLRNRFFDKTKTLDESVTMFPACCLTGDPAVKRRRRKGSGDGDAIHGAGERSAGELSKSAGKKRCGRLRLLLMTLTYEAMIKL